MGGGWLFLTATLASGRQATINYVGVGSNLSRYVLTRRIGGEPISCEPCVLPGMRLAFTAIGFGGEPAFASVEEADDGSVECQGVLYALSLPQFGLLCATEGVPLAYSVVPVLARTGCREVGASALRAVGPGLWLERVQGKGALRPSKRYIELMIRGASEAGLGAEWIDHLREYRVPETRSNHVLDPWTR